MKKTVYYIILFALSALTVVSCEERPAEMPIARVRVTVTLDGSPFAENAAVSMISQSHSIRYSETLRGGFASFSVPIGMYNITVFHSRTEGDDITVYGGSVMTRVDGTDGQEVRVELTETKSNQLLIKELYIGGCQADDGSGDYQLDSYVVLYNNAGTEYDASDICFAFCSPMNSQASNRHFINGRLSYESEGWIPAIYSIWWFDSDVVIPPYSQITVAIFGAIDHTLTYSNSVDLSRGEYYAMYHPESGFSNTRYYTAPSQAIPTTHYLKTYVFGQGSAWPISNSGPAFYILERPDIETLVNDASNYDYTYPSSAIVKVPVDDVVDAVEVFAADQTGNIKRIPADLDAGYITHRNQRGYSIYRNVNRAATEALAENAGLLIYEYSGGTVGSDTVGSTDPSGIDAEASIANGAKIIYQDSNNSTNDFHLRKEASLRYGR